MAHFYRTAGGWRAQIARHGVRDSEVFPSKARAVAWATQREAEILAGASGEIIPQTVADALARYSRDESPKRAGARWEQIRLAKFARELPFRGMQLVDVRAADIAKWRDDAVAGGLAPASVRREMALLRSVLEIARREWGMLKTNPMDGVSRPANGRPRDRRVTDAEIGLLLLGCGWGDGEVAATAKQRVGVAILWALETGMRSGELVGLTWPDIHEADRYAQLPMTKNGEARKVPLSSRALALLKCLPKGGDTVFGLTDATRDTLFREARKAAGIDGVTFHDLRHEATTRLARRLDILDLARMIGHRDLRSLQVYYNATPAEIAARLD